MGIKTSSSAKAAPTGDSGKAAAAYEVDWSSILAALFDRDEIAAVLGGASSGAAAAGRSGQASSSAEANAPATPVDIDSPTLAFSITSTVSRINIAEDMLSSADQVWSRLAGLGTDSPFEVVSGDALLDGPGFRTAGLFLYFDEDGGGLDGTEVLFAEFRPALDGGQIIFF